LFVSTLTVTPRPAAAVDINGLVSTAIAISARYGRPPAAHNSGRAAAKSDRDSEDGDDEDSGGSNRKSASTPTQPQRRPASAAHKSMEAASGNSADSMVMLDRSLDNR